MFSLKLGKKAIIWLLVINFPQNSCNYEDDHVSKAIKSILKKVLDKHDKAIVPQLANQSKSHLIDVFVGIHSIYDVSEHDSSFKVSYLLRLKWMDTRFKFTPIQLPDGEMLNGTGTSIDNVKDKGKMLAFGFKFRPLCTSPWQNYFQQYLNF